MVLRLMWHERPATASPSNHDTSCYEQRKNGDDQSPSSYRWDHRRRSASDPTGDVVGGKPVDTLETSTHVEGGRRSVIKGLKRIYLRAAVLAQDGKFSLAVPFVEAVRVKGVQPSRVEGRTAAVIKHTDREYPEKILREVDVSECLPLNTGPPRQTDGWDLTFIGIPHARP